MSDVTPRLALPTLPLTPVQPQVTHNEALLQLDALVFARLLDRDLSAPPSSPADGDTYLVKATASGAWTGQNGRIAYAADGAWRFYAPFTGLAAYVVDENVLIVFTGSAWVDYASILAFQNLPLLGVNTTADTTNKLAVKSAALLFDNTGAGVQAKLNKHGAGDTASLLYQDNYSGRAEIGLTGDDDLHLKVSPDGSSWTSALTIDRTTGLLNHVDGTVPRTLSVQNSGSVNDSASGSGAYVNHTPNFALPANFLKAGRVLRITCLFRLTTGSAPPSLELELLAGSTVLAHNAPGAPLASLTNVQWGMQYFLQAIDAPGVAANVECGIVANSNNVGAVAAVDNTAMPVALATNGALTLQVATKWSAAGTGTTTIKLSQFIVEALN
ncbi:MAG TPA: DUF2793 domain-containing protein [Rhizomicrobium sp.]